jgi:hypothetical protein
MTVRVQLWRGMGLWLLLGISVVLTIAGAINIGPAWAAHFGHGISGTWTATAEQCSKSCTLVGNFTPTASSVPSVFDASIGTGSRSSAIGDSELAIEVSGQIFPVGGGYDWFVCTAMLLVGVCGLPVCLWFAVQRYRRLAAEAGGEQGKPGLAGVRWLGSLTTSQKVVLGTALVPVVAVCILGLVGVRS